MDEATITLGYKNYDVTFEFFEGDPDTGVWDEYHILEVVEVSTNRVVYTPTIKRPIYLRERDIIRELEDMRNG